jgi:hypothetical protein
MKNNRLHLPRLSVLCALCTVIFAFASADSALAQDWRFEPIFKVGGEYDDNATLDPRTDQEVDLSGLLLDARTTAFSLQPRIVSRNYDDDSAFDSDDFFIRSIFRRRVKLSTVGFRLNFEDQSVRTGERANSDLEIEDPDELTNDDSGRVLRTGSRQKLRVSPYWNYQLSNVSSIGASLDYFDSSYDDVFAGLLTDYTDTRLNLQYRRSISDVTAGLISLTGRRYDSDDNPEETDGYGISAGIEHSLSEKTRIMATIGLEETDTSSSESDPEVIGAITLTRSLETIRFFAQYRRSVWGSGAGVVSTRDSLDLSFRRRLNERISAGLGVRAYQTDDSGGLLLEQGNDYVQLHSSLTWYFTRSFVIEADYRYTVIDRGELLGERANSNQVNVWFVYQPKTIPRI